MNVPVPFTGTDEQKRANYATHRFTRDEDGEVRCWNCDCKPWHVAATYPCGVTPPRMDINV